MQVSKSLSAHQNSESEAAEDQIARFDNSLHELRDLSSQLYYAADYSEKSFLNVKQKTIVVENTKQFLCSAMVAIVDHLGCVSANLNRSISKINAFSEAELRINCLQQRLLVCEQYAHKLALRRVRFSPNLPKFHRRYLSMPITCVGESDEDGRDSESPASKEVTEKFGFDTDDLPLFLYTNHKLCPFQKDKPSTSELPVGDGLSVVLKSPTTTFHFQKNTENHGERGGRGLFKKSLNSNNHISSLIRRTKQATWPYLGSPTRRT